MDISQLHYCADCIARNQLIGRCPCPFDPRHSVLLTKLSGSLWWHRHPACMLVPKLCCYARALSSNSLSSTLGRQLLTCCCKELGALLHQLHLAEAFEED